MLARLRVVLSLQQLVTEAVRVLSLAAGVLEDAMAAYGAHTEAASREAPRPERKLSVFELRARGGADAGPPIPCTPQMLCSLHRRALASCSCQIACLLMAGAGACGWIQGTGGADVRPRIPCTPKVQHFLEHTGQYCS